MAGENPFTLELRDNSTQTISVLDDRFESLQELAALNLERLQAAGVSFFPPPSAAEEDDEGYKRGLTRNDSIVSLSEGDQQGYKIETNNLVGFISYQGTRIIIRSRFARQDGNDFFLHYLMQKTLRLSTIDLPMPVSDCESILDLLVLLFPSYLTRAVSQGVFKQYQRFHYNDYRPKGTIDVARHIKCNVPFRGKIAYNTREQSYDNPVTQLVRHTIEVIRNKPGYSSLLNLSPEVASAVRQIELATPSYVRKELVAVVNANHRPCSHPLLTEYLPLQQLCLKILRNEDEGLRFTTTDDEVYGELFDISYLWEEYLAFLLQPLGFVHPSNVRGKFWDLAKKGSTKKLLFCPDFLFDPKPKSMQGYTPPTTELVCDAKYKQYEAKKSEDSDVFQMLRYMYALRAKYVLLLSPASKSSGRLESHFDFNGYGGTLDVRFLEIEQKADSYQDFCSKMQTHEAQFKSDISYFLQRVDLH